MDQNTGKYAGQNTGQYELQSSDASALIERAMGNYLEALERGEPMTPQQLIEQFPTIGDSLGKLLSAMQTLDEGFSNMPLKFGRWSLSHMIGQGGSAVVYEAHDTSGQRAALKLFKNSSSENSEARFVREVEILASIDHPGIVRLIDHGLQNGIRYIACEVVDGCNLSELLNANREGRVHDVPKLAISPRFEVTKAYTKAAMETIAEASDALAAAHKCAIIHRDLKPSNLLIDHAGHAHLTDFGMAMHTSSPARLTQTGRVVGTLGYISPEVAQGESATEKSDLYSLGIVALELLTMASPSKLASSLPWASLDRSQSPRDFNQWIPSRAERLLQQLISADPMSRPASAQFVSEQFWLAASEVGQRKPGLSRSIFLGGCLLVVAAALAFWTPKRDTVSRTDFPTVAEGKLETNEESTESNASTPQLTLTPSAKPTELSSEEMREAVIASTPAWQLNVAQGDVKMEFRFFAVDANEQKLSKVALNENFFLGLAIDSKIKRDDQWNQSIMLACRVGGLATKGMLKFTGNPKPHRAYAPSDKFMATNDGSTFGPIALAISDRTTSELELDNSYFHDNMEIVALIPVVAIKVGTVSIKPLLPTPNPGRRNFVRHAVRELVDSEITVEPLELEITSE